MSLVSFTSSATGLWQVLAITALVVSTCIALAPAVMRLYDFFLSSSERRVQVWGVEQAERGTFTRNTELSEAETFQLEKRAFLSKTWIFVCHKSRFDKPGDYHTFDVGGLAFFVVLGKDDKIRAFQNVCRHRAYTVVRKTCGNSTRFTCRYHGWQYDDQGKLIKAPKFENSPSFSPEENGLFEIKLILTRDGLVYVNFDATTMDLPFNNVESGLDMTAYKWLDGALISTSANWKVVSKEFLSQAHWSRIPFGWISPRKTKAVRLLGPLSIARDLDDDVWATMMLLPISPSESAVRIDVYSKPNREVSSKITQMWNWMLEQEIVSMANIARADNLERPTFAYECGGRMIDLAAVLEQHQRSELLARRKLHPAIRVTGFDEADKEAAALCDAIDEAAARTVGLVMK